MSIRDVDGPMRGVLYEDIDDPRSCARCGAVTIVYYPAGTYWVSICEPCFEALGEGATTMLAMILDSGYGWPDSE